MMYVKKENCIGCSQCINDCPFHLIHLDDENKAEITNDFCMNCGHCLAICPTGAVATDHLDMEEVMEYQKETFDIDSNQLLNFIKYRRSVRNFKKKEVENEVLEKIIEAGRFTPTGTNSQDVSYVVVKEKLPQLKEAVLEALNQKGLHILSSSAKEMEPYKPYATLWTNIYNAHKEDPLKNDGLTFHAPAIILVTANSSTNGALASSSMELMTHALGLGTFYSGFMIMALNENKDLLKFLEIDSSKTVVSCLVIGYPNVSYKRTVPRNKANITWL